MRRDFASRDELVSYCREMFPDAAARDDHVSPVRGGGEAARASLAVVEPGRYARTRNALDGAVTRLSPYLRHGVLTLAEVRDEVVGRGGECFKLVQELAWRDYYQRVLGAIGEGVWADREPYKTGVDDYLDELPPDIEAGRTTVDFVDAAAEELAETGYLHNQLRMKVAAYVVHARGVAWQAGARWFLRHLLDGDIASNNLSWQWVASTFSHRPYIFNTDNLAKISGGRFTGENRHGHSPFAGTYDDVRERLFG